jgi:ATP-binding cassette, subfamily B, bacterial
VCALVRHRHGFITQRFQRQARQALTERPTPRQRIQAAFQLGRALRLVRQTAPVWTLVNTGLVVVQGVFPLAALWVLKHVLDAVAAAVSVPGRSDLLHQVWVWILLAAGIALLTALARLLGEYAMEAQSLQVTDAVAEILHTQSIAVDLAYYEDPSYYDTLHRAQRQGPVRLPRIVNGLAQVAQNGLAVAGIAGWLISLNWLLAAALLIGVLPGAFVRVAFSRRLYGLLTAQTERERLAWYYHCMLTEAPHAQEVRLFNLGALIQSRCRELLQHIRSSRLTLVRHRVTADSVAEIAATAVLFGSLGWVALQTTRGAIRLSDLAVYYVGFQTALGLLRELLRALAGLYEDNLFLTNLYKFLDVVPHVTAPPRPTPVPRPVTRGITFHEVAFRYPGHASDTLQDIDLTLAPGEVVALVGANGSGKSTLVKLLCRLYDPTRGAITVDDIDLRELAPVQWRRELSVAFQDYARYALTASENIWFGDLDSQSDSARIAEAGRWSGADGFIRQLPRGYDTQLGRMWQDGQELSEGEWQRIATARAFFRDARILVLDEPSSSLDPLAEAELLRQFRELLGGRSAIIVSHRLSTVQTADRIYVMDRGRFVERGTHAALLAQGGQYARLYHAQAQHYQSTRQE